MVFVRALKSLHYILAFSMSTVLERHGELTLADLHRRFGAMPTWRIQRDPPPGTATESDVLAYHERENNFSVLDEL